MIKTQLRIPDDVWTWVKAEAERNDRSANAEAVRALRQSMAATAADQSSEETGASVSQTSAPASRVTPEGHPK